MRNKAVLLWISLLCMMVLAGCKEKKYQTKQENDSEINLSFEAIQMNTVEEKADYSKGDLLARFVEMNNENVVKFLYDDYNKDGLHEAFVLTKVDNYFNLWFVNPGVCEIVCEQMDYVDEQKTDILSFSTKDYLLVQQMLNGRLYTFVYSVNNDNKVRESNISQKGYVHLSENGELLLDIYMDSDNTSNKAPVKTQTYYLYYVFDEGFKEYGAIPIGEEQFLEFEGAQDILNEVYEKYEGYEIACTYLYRANHYIHINITILRNDSVENKNITLRYDKDSVMYVSGEFESGKIETAHMLEIATFPTAFKRP